MNTKENTASKKSKIMEVLQNCKKEAEKFGVELDYDPDIFFDDDHLDPVWYGGSIASLKYKGYELSIEVHGDVEIVGDLDGEDFLYKNRENTGAMNLPAADTLRTTFKSDEELNEALVNGDIWYEDNNWIEAAVKDPDGYWHESIVVDEAYDVLDACDNISAWVDFLDKDYVNKG